MRKSITINLTKLAAYGASLILITVSALILYWGLQPSTGVLEIYNDPLQVKPEDVPAGGKAIAYVDFCKKGDQEGTVEVNLIGETGGAKITVNWPADKLDAVCTRDYPQHVECDAKAETPTCIELPIPIPGQTPSDIYHAVFTVTYKLNPLKQSETVFRTRSFKVVNPKLQ